MVRKSNGTIKYYLPTRKKTEVIYYASDGFEGTLYQWELNTSSSTTLGVMYSTNITGYGGSTNWGSSNTIYVLNGNVFSPRELWGEGGWLDDYGYGNVVYDVNKTGLKIIRFTSSDYPSLIRIPSSYYTIPETETTEKLYLPVRKNNGTTKYYI